MQICRKKFPSGSLHGRFFARFCPACKSEGHKPVSRNAALLKSFSDYCQEYPEQRFWQALLNWSGLPFIVITQRPAHEYRNVNDAKDIPVDPYNWEDWSEHK
jgi:hypothetical protein